MNELNQFLQQQRDAGSVESAGSFTLAIDKARDKLGQYSLPQQEDYVLKLVQCAVVLGVDTLHIQLTRDSVLVHFELDLDDKTLAVDKLTGSLVSPLEEKNRARAHLTIALCSIASQEPVELMWGEWSGDKADDLILSLGHNRSELFRNPPFPRSKPLAGDKRFHLLFLKKPSSKLPLSQTAAEHHALTTRCCFAPTNLEVNKKSLRPYLPNRDAPGDHLTLKTSYYLACLRIESDEKASLRWTGSEGKSQGRPEELPGSLYHLLNGLPPVQLLEAPPSWQAPFLQDTFFNRLYFLPVYLTGKSHLYYVQDGVLLAPLICHSVGGGAVAIFDGNHLKTDVTGLAPVDDDSLLPDKERATEVWGKLAEQYQEAEPAVYLSSLTSSSDDLLFYLLRAVMVGPLRSVFGPMLDKWSQKEVKLAQRAREVKRQVASRIGYLDYVKPPS